LILKKMWGTKVSGQVNNGWRLQYTHRQMKEVAVHVTSYNDKKKAFYDDFKSDASSSSI